MKSFKPYNLTLLAQAIQVGGAERSLLEYLTHQNHFPFFILRGEGSLADEVKARGWDSIILPLPLALQTLTQRGSLCNFFFALPQILLQLPAYLRALAKVIPVQGDLISLGVKYHLISLLLGSRYNNRRVYDIRDFIQPRLLRLFLGWTCDVGLAKAIVNSKAVAKDFPHPTIRYPQVHLPRVAKRKSYKPGDKRIITHLAYFAPYKGQDYFLDIAEAWLNQDPDLEFWIIGEVIYPSPSYLGYATRIKEKAAHSKFASRIRFLGAIQGREELMQRLEQTDLLLHCTLEPEPFGRAVMEALLCGCEVICHRDSGVCEITRNSQAWPKWMQPLKAILSNHYVRVVPDPAA